MPAGSICSRLAMLCAVIPPASAIFPSIASAPSAPAPVIMRRRESRKPSAPVMTCVLGERDEAIERSEQLERFLEEVLRQRQHPAERLLEELHDHEQAQAAQEHASPGRAYQRGRGTNDVDAP